MVVRTPPTAARGAASGAALSGGQAQLRAGWAVAAGMASPGSATDGRVDDDAREWDQRQQECQRSVCFLMAYPRGSAERSQSGTGWVVRDDDEVAALVTARHVVKHVIDAGQLQGNVTATVASGHKVDLDGAFVLSAPVPGAAADPSAEMMDAVVVRLAPGKRFFAPPVPCAVASMDADGSVADVESVSVQQGAACSLLHLPGAMGIVGNQRVVVTPGGKVVGVTTFNGQPWCLTHNLVSDGGSSGGMLIDARCRAMAIHRGRQTSDLKHAVLVNALHVALGRASPWLGAPPVEHGRCVTYGLPEECVNFVGRENQLADLTRVVKGDRKVVVVSTGLPGVGKSTIVREWAHRASQSREYGAVLWLRADTVANLWDDLVGLGQLLRISIPAFEQQSMQKRAAYVKWQLETGVFVRGVALLVFDNADDYAAVRDFVPAGEHCRVVFTARDQETYAGLGVLPLEPFTMQESMLLLRTILSRPIDGEEETSAKELCTEVGHLPLAVEQLAWFAKQSGATLESVLIDVQRSAALAWPLDKFIIAKYERRASVGGALRLVQRQLSEPGRRALQRLALLAPERVPRELLGPDVNAATAALSSRAMIAYPEPGLISTHRLVLSVAQGEMSIASGDHLRATKEVVSALVEHVVGFKQRAAATWGPMRAILPHAEAFSKLKADTSLWSDAGIAKDWLSILKKLYWYTVYCIRDYAAAFRWAERAKDDASTLFPDDSFLPIACAVDIGWVLAEQRKTPEAVSTCLPLLQPVSARLAQVDDSWTDGPRDVLSVAFNLAVSLRWVGRTQEAVPLIEQLLPISEARRGRESLSTLEVKMEKAEMLVQTGKVDQAANLFEELLRVPETPALRVMLSSSAFSLARLREAKGELDEALALWTRARDLDAASFGEEHIEVAVSEHNIGCVLVRQGKLEEAEKLLKEALRKKIAMVGEDGDEARLTRAVLTHVQEKLEEQRLTAQTENSASSAGDPVDTERNRPVSGRGGRGPRCVVS